MLSQEINEMKTMSTVFPVIFLGVAAFLLNVVLSRQIATQRGEIAALKAMGYTNTTIAAHYFKLVLLIVSLGILMGVLLGAWLGYQLTSMYTAFFHFPELIYRVQPWIPLAAAGISLVAALGGALNTMAQYHATGTGRSHASACPHPVSSHAAGTAGPGKIPVAAATHDYPHTGAPSAAYLADCIRYCLFRRHYRVRYVLA
ncbi:MAG TPA: hypothetical protein DCQ77_06310 [Betaproteobacteria bacterium]|nr:hypothetical protein [Betaproteobacteria bacterium]